MSPLTIWILTLSPGLKVSISGYLQVNLHAACKQVLPYVSDP